MNYVIGKSIFGDYWIERTKEPIEGKMNFEDFEAAQEAIRSMNPSLDNWTEVDVEEEDYFADTEEEFLREEMYKHLIS